MNFIEHLVFYDTTVKKEEPMDKITRKELRHADPLLRNPDLNIEHNLAEGIDDMVPDPDDVPSGFNADGTIRPDLMEADANCLAEQNLLRVKILNLRGK